MESINTPSPPNHHFSLREGQKTIYIAPIAVSDVETARYFSPLAVVLLLVRLGLRLWRKERWNHGDTWGVVSIVFIITRIVLSYLVLVWGSVMLLSPEYLKEHENDMTADDIRRLQTSGKVSIANRLALVSALWALKFMVLDFLWRIIRKLPYERRIMTTYIVALLATWTVAVIAGLVECRPFHGWWQVYPDPGNCVQANQWLITYEVGNMVTDAMLLALPFPLLFMARVPWEKRVRLCAVFSLGFFLLAICIVRMVQGLSHSGTRGQSQPQRAMWAAIETLFATIVACGPSMYCILRRGKERDTVTSASNNTFTQRAGGGAPRPPGSPNGSISISLSEGKDSVVSNGERILGIAELGGGIGATVGTPISRDESGGYYRPRPRARPRPLSEVSAVSALSVGPSHEEFMAQHEQANQARQASQAQQAHWDPTRRAMSLGGNISYGSSSNEGGSSSNRRNTMVNLGKRMSFGAKSKLAGLAGFHRDAPILDGEIIVPRRRGRRGSVMSSIWTHSSTPPGDLELLGRQKSKIEEEEVELEQEKFWIIDEERDTGTGDICGIMVQTTWTQFHEPDDEAENERREVEVEMGKVQEAERDICV
ncbi:hypothetical protein DRE_03553 [Drechslerella stenobrocha 248]|uniref:Rhodopsin domain-containing protein n=1 Tax=Drechslerella stenobrocha 248 TaxID=1043628 RepID=W7HUK3_9PEZI|nr:hypothetical protein DRE_03553 [Drechslerella stenobrocha 248]